MTFDESVVVARFSELPGREPVGVALFGDELVIIRNGERYSVLSGRCLHRGARLADGLVVGDDLICRLHRPDGPRDSDRTVTCLIISGDGAPLTSPAKDAES